ncbi:MAG: hypothetical protein ABNH15_11945 [Alcanivorax sp.]|jgi:hypothetical protein|tara:strand:- start:5134 stop:5688 length:555 start_codon:yes stop_codon:yes gene_type:complete
MSDNITPEFLQDISVLLSDSGFATNDTWYHGTSSGLVESIMTLGLSGGGDTETTERTQSTLGTIGNRQFESSEPVFLTQSKELAFYWAAQKTHTRNLYFKKDEIPVVIQVSQPEKVSPDVGGTAMLLEPSNQYILTLKAIYEQHGVAWNDANPLEVPREFYLEKLGLAYSSKNIPAEKLSILVP